MRVAFAVFAGRDIRDLPTRRESVHHAVFGIRHEEFRQELANATPRGSVSGAPAAAVTVQPSHSPAALYSLTALCSASAT